MKSITLGLLIMLLLSCTSVPEGVSPVSGFDKTQYLGKWYEIARLDHSFERGLSKVTATYSLRDDGGIDVVNQGYNSEKQEWQSAQGKAYFVDEASIGHLKVSFFGPFYASYVIAALDKQDYQYALVTGPDHDYLWILARTPKLAPEIKSALLAQAAAAGFDTESLIYVSHE